MSDLPPSDTPGEESLPVETWINLFKFLDGFTLISVIRTCKLFKSLGDQNEIWKCLVQSYKKRGDLASKYLPDVTEMAFSLSDNPEEEDDAPDDSELDQIRQVLANHSGDPESMERLTDMLQRLSMNQAPTGPEAEVPIVAEVLKVLQNHTHKKKNEGALKNTNWKQLYRTLSRTLTVHRDIEYAGAMRTSMLTTHTEVSNQGDRQRLFYSLREAVEAARPFDTIYLHSSEEEKIFPDKLLQKHIHYTAVAPKVLEAMSKKLRERGEADAEVKEWVHSVHNPVASEPLPDRHVLLPSLVVTTPNLTILGRGAGQLMDEVGSGVMMPIYWMAPNGIVATVDLVRYFLHLSAGVSLKALDINFEIPVELERGCKLAMLDCNVHELRNDDAFLHLPLSLDFELQFEHVEIAARLNPREQLILLTKLISAPLAFIEDSAVLTILPEHPAGRTPFSFGSGMKENAPEVKMVPVSLLQLCHRYMQGMAIESYSISHQRALGRPHNIPRYPLNTDPNYFTNNSTPLDPNIPPEALHKLRKTYLQTIVTLLEQDVFENEQDDFNMLGLRCSSIIRNRLIQWMPHFPNDETLVESSLSALRSVPEDQILDFIESSKIDTLAIPYLLKYIDNTQIAFTCVGLLNKLFWSSDILVKRLGVSDSLWQCVDILMKKCTGELGKYVLTEPPTTDASGLQLSGSSEIKNIAPKKEMDVCYRSSMHVSHILDLFWCLSTYPETATLIMQRGLPFIMWAHQNFSKDARLMDDVCGIGQALLDCLPHQTTQREECARLFVEAGAVQACLNVYKLFPTFSTLTNADYFLRLLIARCPGPTIDSYLANQGTKVLITAITRRSYKGTDGGSIDMFTALPSIVEIDSEWAIIKAWLDDHMFTADRANIKVGAIAMMARGVALCPKRRLELANMGFLPFVESIQPHGHLAVASLVDAIDSLCRDPAVLSAKATQLRSAALHLQTHTNAEDTIAWINTIVDATKPYVDADYIAPAGLPERLRMRAMFDSPSAIKLSSDGLTCYVIDNCFHTFTLPVPGGKITTGRWAYEVVLNSDGPMQIGWATSQFTPSLEENLGVGDDEASWGIDLSRMIKWHKGIHPHSNFLSLDPSLDQWMRSQTIFVGIDCEERRITFILDEMPPIFFDNVDIGDGVFPAFTIARSESITINPGYVPFNSAHIVQRHGYKPIIGDVTWTEDEIDRRMMALEQYREDEAADMEADDPLNLEDMGLPDVDEEEDEEDEEEEEPEFVEEDFEENEEGEEDEEDDQGDLAHGHGGFGGGPAAGGGGGGGGGIYGDMLNRFLGRRR